MQISLLTLCRSWMFRTIVMTMAIFCLGYLSEPFNFWPIRGYEVQGSGAHLSYVSQNLEPLLDPLKGQSLLTVSLEAVTDYLQQECWVADFSVKRHWPPWLTVTVTPPALIASWGDDWVVTMQGEILPIDVGLELKDLPRWECQEDQLPSLLQWHQQWLPELQSLVGKIQKMTLTATSDVVLVLENGPKVYVSLLRTEHQVQELTKLLGHWSVQDLIGIDLRYSVGVAIEQHS